MNIPLLTWGCIAGLFLIILLVRFVKAIILCVKRKHRIISSGSEREEFYLPGDPDPKAIDNYDNEDFDDL